MDICFVSNVVYPFVTGGAEKRIHEIGTRLADADHAVTIYGRHYWEGPKVMEYEGMTLRAVAPAQDLYTDERRSITEAIDFAARLLPTLRRRIDEHDIAVASVFPYFPVLATKAAAIGTDTPVVTTWHEVWGDYWEEYLGKLAVGGKIIEQLTARVPQHPIAVSNITADRLADLGINRSDIQIVPNGLDNDQVQSAPLPTDTGADSYDILFAGRLIEDKRVDVLLDAFDQVAGEHDVQLGIIGDGPEKERLEEQATNLTHSDRVSFEGFLEEYDDVLGHMRAADIFASPSTREGFGITYAEAMAAGCTVIGADHPESAASEVIGDGGLVTEPTVDGIATALEAALASDSPDISPTSKAQEYDWDNVAKQAEATYRCVVESQ